VKDVFGSKIPVQSPARERQLSVRKRHSLSTRGGLSCRNFGRSHLASCTHAFGLKRTFPEKPSRSQEQQFQTSPYFWVASCASISGRSHRSSLLPNQVEPKGIIGSKVVTAESVEGPHWIPDRASQEGEQAPPLSLNARVCLPGFTDTLLVIPLASAIRCISAVGSVAVL